MAQRTCIYNLTDVFAGKAKVVKDEWQQIRAAKAVDDDGWLTVTKNRKQSTGEAASPDTSPVASLHALETSPRLDLLKSEYFDLTGYSVYNIINLDNGLRPKPVLIKDF